VATFGSFCRDINVVRLKRLPALGFSFAPHCILLQHHDIHVVPTGYQIFYHLVQRANDTGSLQTEKEAGTYVALKQGKAGALIGQTAIVQSS